MRLLKRRKCSAVVLLLCLGVAVFLIGQAVTNVSAIPREEYESLETFTNILAIIKKNYVDEVDTKELLLGAINGMLHSMDPHSAYLNPELYKELQADTRGKFGGLGIEITMRGGSLPWSLP